MKIIQAITSLSLSLLFSPIAWAGGDYKYDLRIDATVPSVLDGDGPTIDKCVKWRNDANDSNYTWYGLQVVGLPEDATYDDYSNANGFVQQYNSAPRTILSYQNITTSESELSISINVNDKDTRTYMVPVSNVNENHEFVWTWSMWGEVTCFDANGNIFPPVVPTLTISIIRAGTDGGDNTGTGGGCGGELKLSTGAIVGIIFACIVVLSISLVMLMLCIMRRDERKEKLPHNQEDPIYEQLL